MLLKEITQPQEIPIAFLARKLVGKQSFAQIKKIIAGAMPDYNVDLVKVDLPSGEGTISAWYEPEDDEDEQTSINIELQFSKADDSFTWDKQSRTGFLRRLASTIKHELIHQRQYRNRDFIEPPEGRDQRDPNYEYMSRTDEIEAYAMNIADELALKAGKAGALQLLKMAGKTATFKDKMGNLLSPDLFAYMAMWKFDTTNPVLKRLLKKIYAYLMQK